MTKVYTQLEETFWLVNHPEFTERPASIGEFIDKKKYLGLGSKVRPGVRQALEEIFGEDVSGDRLSLFQKAMFTGAIGVGKTTFASIALPYMAHWVLCLRDPQEYYNLLPGSRIAFMQMSTSEDQARQVIFGDIKARIEYSPWFRDNHPYDPKFTKSIRFDKDIWILPGDSAETTFEGYNILGGILDEADSHKLTKEKDYAEIGYDTIEGRILSRFVDNRPGASGHRGLAIIIGQMKKANGFAFKKYEEFLEDPTAKVVRMTIWDSYGWDKYTDTKTGERDSFWYDIKRKQILPDWVGQSVAGDEPGTVIEIPNAYKQNFKTNPEKALKDLAGIPPQTSDPFISMTYKITEAVDRWVQSHGQGVIPIGSNCTRPEVAEWLGTTEYTDSRKRVAHIDIAYSENGDSASVAVGHIKELTENHNGDLMPYIVIDCLARWRAPAGGEVMISDLRGFLYMLKSRGMRIDKVTLDGFQSTDTMQQLRKKKMRVDYLSLDRSKLGYEDLREALYEDRLEFPPYLTYELPGSQKLVDILYKELTNLSDTGTKIDHPKDGSKDVADSVAGVVCTLMGDGTYRKGVSSKRTEGDLPAMTPQQALDEFFGDFKRATGNTTSPQLAGPDTSIPDFIRPGEIEIPDRLRVR